MTMARTTIIMIMEEIIFLVFLFNIQKTSILTERNYI